MPSESVTETPRALPSDRAWSINIRVIGALLLREMLTRYGRNNIGFLWLIVEPMLFTLAITGIWVALREIHRSDIPIVAFALTGYSSVLLWRNMPGRCIGALSSNRALLFHRQVKMIDVYIARIALEFVGITISFIGIGLALWAIEWIEPPEDLLVVLIGWILLAWFGAALALTLGSMSERYHVIEKIWPAVALILFPLSGAAFMVDALPPAARETLLYLPMLHGVEFLREGFFGSHIRAHYDLGYLMVVNTALTLFGLTQVRRVVPGESRDF
jgi:ABC-type polysaccharide/polyol phosphate export permease